MPITISLRFPTGRYAAATPDHNDVEWPPHPARLVLGMIDVLHKHGNAAAQRTALTWLCQQGAPELVIPDHEHVDFRKMAGFYVPQNPAAASGIDHKRKERSFPTAYVDPEVPTVYFYWSESELDPQYREALNDLVNSLPRFGHSSSLVMATLSEDPPPEGGDWEHWQPASDSMGAECYLRVPYPRLLAAAEEAYDVEGRKREREALIAAAAKSASSKKVLKPQASPRGRHDPPVQWQAYQTPALKGVVATPWDHRCFLLARVSGPRLSVQETWHLTELLHRAILDRWCREPKRGPVPPWISGHEEGVPGESTKPTRNNHLAFFPLPNVGYPHSDGRLLGLGIAFPTPETAKITGAQIRIDWQNALAALFAGKETLELHGLPGHSQALVLQPVDPGETRSALQLRRWNKPSCIWQSITPFIFERHPKPSFRKDPHKWQKSCQELVALACRRAGLPALEAVAVSPYSPLTGVPPAPAFPAPSARASRPQRVHYHVSLQFEERVQGPLLLGAGRFRGYGLFCPVS